ncbi:unnamed protein product, partial [Meganyctiphanes norvegica]
RFTKKIVAPTCMKVNLKFTSFNLYKKITSGGVTYCYFEYMFLRFGKDLTEGNMYCGKDITADQSFISETNTMILYSQSELTHNHRWSAKIEFVSDPECNVPSTENPIS